RERRRPSRKLRRRPEAPAQREIVHLDHDAVRVELEVLALLVPLADEGHERLDPFARPPMRLDGKAPCLQRLERPAVRQKAGCPLFLRKKVAVTFFRRYHHLAEEG